MTVADPKHLQGVVDMGSNGIRFSITNLVPPTTRLLPTIYTHRAGISLYDAQYPAGSSTRQPIPDEIITAVLLQLLRFKQTCSDFAVPEDQITLLATEATRTAVNTDDFLSKIKKATGWTVILLAKEEEGRLGAMGVASSLDLGKGAENRVEGLVMDLGGGSTQLTWIEAGDDDAAANIGSSVSLPFGAAALSRRLAEAEGQGRAAVSGLSAEVRDKLTEAWDVLKQQRKGGHDHSKIELYLSGGGFRGWGYVLMSQRMESGAPYPISTIDGFTAGREDFLNTAGIQAAVLTASSTDVEAGAGIFRISKRRASQVPAVAFLIQSLALTVKEIDRVHFCQGGVREGFLLARQPPAIQAESPLEVVTQPFARGSVHALVELLQSSLQGVLVDTAFSTSMLRAFASTMYHHASHSKDVTASAALRFTTTGALASATGLSHRQRAVLSLLLCESWGGRDELAPSDEPFFDRLAGLVDDPTRWWCKYLGAVAVVIRARYPAGLREGKERRLHFEAGWRSEGHGRQIRLTVHMQDGHGFGVLLGGDLPFMDALEPLTKVGKRKKAVGGPDGYRHKVEVTVVQDH